MIGFVVMLYEKINYSENDIISTNLGNNEIQEYNDQNNTKEIKNNAEDEVMEKSKIYIHIIGEVNNEGIVELEEGSRIIDAIEKAGGVTENADVSKVNLAFELSDGQKVRIPSLNENNEDNQYVTEDSGVEVLNEEQGIGGMSSNNKVNINTASQTELETLTGIGPSIAAKIIKYREENGKFKNIEDLKNVSGIGDSKFEGLKDEIKVK